jgi:LacI family transcriptional regulator
MASARIKISTVAAAAGVSVTTVSHVLNDVPGKRVSEQTRRKVREAADRLGYVPNEVARQLRAQRSFTLGLISDVVATTPFAGGMVQGAQEAASRKGFLLMLLNTGFDPELEQREIRALLQGRVDGVLYATMYHRPVQLPEQLKAVPTVLLDATAQEMDVPSVVPDEEGGGYSATRELLAHGHRHIGFVINEDDIPATRGRLAGYRRALEEAGVAFDPRLVEAGATLARGGYVAASALLTRADRPTALFCFNDRMAMGAYQQATVLGLRIPEDLSVVGFDDQAGIADGLMPGLTTVALPHYEMGRWAVEAVLARIEDPQAPIENVRLPCPLVRRDSVTAPPSRS